MFTKQWSKDIENNDHEVPARDPVKIYIKLNQSHKFPKMQLKLSLDIKEVADFQKFEDGRILRKPTPRNYCSFGFWEKWNDGA